MSSRRAALIDDDDRSRPSIPIRLNKSNSWMDTPAKSSKDEDSSDVPNSVRAVSRGGDQHSHLSNNKSTVENYVSGDGYTAESDEGADEASGEVASVDAVRDNDDASADITSVGEGQAADASIVSTETTNHRLRVNVGPNQGFECKATHRSEESLTPAAANGASAFHKFAAEVSPDGPDLEVQLKQPKQVDKQLLVNDEVASEVAESDVEIPTTQESRQPETTDSPKKGCMSTKTWLLVAIVFILVVAGIGAALGGALAGSRASAISKGQSSPTEPPHSSPYASPSVANKCSFCFDGTVPQNLENNTIRNNTSCLDFSAQLSQLHDTDPLCPTGQALSWRYCGCPTLPPAPVRPSCTLCPNGTNTSTASAQCKDLSTLVAIVGSSRLSNCNDLRTQVLTSCSCPKNVIRSAAITGLLSPISGFNNTGDATSWQLDALNWISNEDLAQIPPDSTRLREITERYVAALLFFATNGSKWYSFANFLSPSSVCQWNTNNIGLFCNGASQLEAIRLSSNNLKGTIPSEISTLTELITIAIASNDLSGSLPASLGDLRQLVTLQIQNNAFTSTLPESVFNIPSLQELLISTNNFRGSLPTRIGNAVRLRSFVAHTNALTGPLPDSLRGLPSLVILDLQDNVFSGTLPPLEASISLVALNLGRNFISGTIPAALTSTPGLKTVGLAKLNLTGPLPDFSSNNGSLDQVELFGNLLTGNLGSYLSILPLSIRSLDLHQNLLTGEISTTIGRFTLLNELNLSQNRLKGSIPTEIGQLTQLSTFLRIHGNDELSGTLPTEIGLLTNLEGGLYIYSSAIHGTIPTELGKLTRLKNIALGSNHLTGSIPSQLRNLSLRRLSVSNNILTGSMETLFSFLPPTLVLLKLDTNLLNGTLPSTIGAFASLTSLTLQLNYIDGTLPSEIGLLTSLEGIFDVHGNTILGKIPSEIGKLVNLQRLDLGDNQFSFSLPSEMGLLSSLTAVDLSGNNLTGSVPARIATLPRLNTLLIFENNMTDVDSTGCANISFFVANSCNSSKIICSCCTNCCNEGSNRCPAVGKRKTP